LALDDGPVEIVLGPSVGDEERNRNVFKLKKCCFIFSADVVRIRATLRDKKLAVSV
jgi:hypothetical protein